MSVKIRSMQTGTASSYKGSAPVNHPLGVYLEGPGHSEGAAEGQLTRELGRLGGRPGELGALPEHPPALAPPKASLPSAQCPWAPPALGPGAQLPRVSLFRLDF